jgi:hypothetical protein
MSQKMPPPSFTMLVQMLATQAMAAMGKIPIPGQEAMEPNFEAAQHFIDLLAVIEEKTKGNLTSQEVGLLAAVTHELRLTYVNEKK